jgi:hypothetical protein
MMRHFSALLSVGVLLAATLEAVAADADPTRVLEPGKLPQDHRLGKPKDLNGYFPLTPPDNKTGSTKDWQKRRNAVRQQVVVAAGLWPLPDRLPVHPVIHGKIDRADYTIEKVFFASYPGHYVCGNLYRPKTASGKLPGVLCPHGHWPNGRFYEAGDKEAAAQIQAGAEKTMAGARYPLQARCAQLARMGCVVFHYDMVGYADSQQIKHTTGFTDAAAELRLQSFMGLQTFNSIRALDFLTSLPDVDPTRIGVTGASGGGTQTFILGAIDDRPAVAFPAVMVSTAMQGGCICENCSYLRQNTGNIELAGLFAPRPLGMTGANDWTLEIETKGLPELRAVYRLYGAEDRVMGRCFPQFPHNYNQVSREVMYNWFNKHLHLGQPQPVVEKPFVPVPPKELSVFDQQHPCPQNAVGAEGLRKTLTDLSDKQMAALQPNDPDTLARFKEIIGTALRVMIDDELPGAGMVEVKEVGQNEVGGYRLEKMILARKGQEEQIPAVYLAPAGLVGSAVVWVHPEGKASLFQNGELVPAAKRILDNGRAIVAADLFLTGEFRPAPAPAVDGRYAGYTFGYNRPLLANRVHDLLTVIAYAHNRPPIHRVDVVAFDKAGPWALLARASCGDKIARTALDLARFRFDAVQTTADEMMLPGAGKYGGVAAFAALCAPGEIFLHNGSPNDPMTAARQAYLAAGKPGHLEWQAAHATPDDVVKWLLR